MQLEEIKNFLSIDFDDDDMMLHHMQEAAEEYIKNSVGQVDTDNPLYKHALTVLVGHWYDNRELTRARSNSYPIPHSFQSIIHQLRSCYP